MDIKEIEELLVNAKKDFENEESIKTYSEAIKTYLKDQKSRDEIVTVVIQGMDIDGASSYFEYIEKAQKNEIPSIGKQIRENKCILENDNNNGLKFLASLLSEIILKKGNIESLSGITISRIVSLIFNDKKPVTTDVYKTIIFDYLVSKILEVDFLPTWNSINFSGEDCKKFSEIIINAIPNESIEFSSIRRWANNGLKYSEELIEKEKIEATIPKSRVDELQDIVEHYKNVEKQVRDNAYLIAKLEKEILDNQEIIKSLNVDKYSLENELEKLKNDLSESKNTISEREEEINQRKEINDAFTALKENDEKGLLNDIAENLKRIHGQMKTAESQEMSIELCGIYREMIKAIFKKLEENGVRME